MNHEVLSETRIHSQVEESSEEVNDALTINSVALICLFEMKKWNEVIIPSTELSTVEVKVPEGGQDKQDGVPIQVKAQVKAQLRDYLKDDVSEPVEIAECSKEETQKVLTDRGNW
ncbi:hypothetical protein GUJ93_ZPchr0014g46930 [Zizania palustris]|uniref:Uncharacterized protein n=1 Tax=Zizania palustris TaxID=103762 RepID=A0A8J5THF9_ZIZPA|nr:hypothetical protein GUJ93_ZPchr0014g46930 [Zizania palustris]